MSDHAIDFSKFTEGQIEALANVAFGGRGAGQNKRRLESLAKAGLITPIERQAVDRLGSFRWTEYEMPLAVHIEFCAWCESAYNAAKGE